MKFFAPPENNPGYATVFMILFEDVSDEDAISDNSNIGRYRCSLFKVSSATACSLISFNS